MSRRTVATVSVRGRLMWTSDCPMRAARKGKSQGIEFAPADPGQGKSLSGRKLERSRFGPERTFPHEPRDSLRDDARVGDRTHMPHSCHRAEGRVRQGKAQEFADAPDRRTHFASGQHEHRRTQRAVIGKPGRVSSWLWLHHNRMKRKNNVLSSRTYSRNTT